MSAAGTSRVSGVFCRRRGRVSALVPERAGGGGAAAQHAGVFPRLPRRPHARAAGGRGPGR